jgi:hypothetical protein
VMAERPGSGGRLRATRVPPRSRPAAGAVTPRRTPREGARRRAPREAAGIIARSDGHATAARRLPHGSITMCSRWRARRADDPGAQAAMAIHAPTSAGTNGGACDRPGARHEVLRGSGRRSRRRRPPSPVTDGPSDDRERN